MTAGTTPFTTGIRDNLQLSVRPALLSGLRLGRSARIWLVQSVTLSRIVASLVFVSLAFSTVIRPVLLGLYVFALVSDVLDGYLARRLKVATCFGKVMDLVADKTLTVVSLLYAASRGIDVLPVALIATREIVMLGMRSVTVDGTQLLPTNRVFGGIMAMLLWANTLLLVYAEGRGYLFRFTNVMCWVCAAVFVLNLFVRVRVSGGRIKAALDLNL